MDGDALKSRFRTLIDKTKRTSSLDSGGSHDIISSDNIALAAAERFDKHTSLKRMAYVYLVYIIE